MDADALKYIIEKHITKKYTVCDSVFKVRYRTRCLNGELVYQKWEARFWAHSWIAGDTMDEAINNAIAEWMESEEG